MAMMGSRGIPSTELQLPKRWKDREISPERTKVWMEPPEKMIQKKVAVVYYLTRNGQLQQPHFMEVPLSTPRGLFLKDVISRLNFLRGEGMAGMYSWSCKRGYGNGFVWQDLTENDFIYPTKGHEYVLKGSELHLLLEEPLILNQASETGSSASSRSSDIHDISKEADSPVLVTRRRNQSCSSIDLYEYKVYKTTANSVSAGDSAAANASTQTDSKIRHKKAIDEKEVEEKIEEQRACEIQTVELSRGEISPPPSDSSPETLETLMKADKRLMLRTGALNGNGQDRSSGNSSSNKIKASTVLMQLLSCGSFPFKDCGATAVKDHGLSLVSSYNSKLPRAEKQSPGVKLEEKEYFSGSLIQTKSGSDDEVIKLKRSFSCNADRYCLSLFLHLFLIKTFSC
uniref:SOSEKI DIX-like domain-containing protein n=1 Tax=Kalanchoe fedtschenkoi TaxID=63787 RepID=A0A7N0TCU4_KALFE